MKKFVHKSNYKNSTIRFLIAIIVVFIIAILVVTGVVFTNNKPMHFKHLGYSTARSDIHKFYGEPDEIKEFTYPKGEFYDVYECEFLGVKGNLEFEYFDDGEDLSQALFIIDSNDFNSYEEYKKAANKTYKYFNRVLLFYQRRNTIVDGEIEISWARRTDNFAYSMYNTQTSDTGYTDDLRDCTIFQFDKYLEEK